MKNITGFVLLFCMVACSEEGFKSQESVSGELIVFTRDDQIHVMNADGSSVRPVGYKPDHAYDVAWSLDGGMIAYVTQDSDGLYVMNMQNLQVKKVSGTYNPGHPSWSPDGNYLAFTNWNFPSFHADEISTDFSMTRIFVASLNDDVITPTNLVVDSLSRSQVIDLFPHWSPDGKKIVFSSNRAFVKHQGWNDVGAEEEKTNIYTMNPDGTTVTRVTESLFSEVNPVWSPDGKKIAFDRRGDGNDSWSIYIMNADGSELFQVTHNLSQKTHRPTWSPDGTRLAFASNHEGNGEIYIINIDGTGLKRLTNDPRNDGHPAWSPAQIGTN